MWDSDTEEEDTLPDLPSDTVSNTDRRRSSLHIEDEYLEGGRRLSIESYLKGRRRSSILQIPTDMRRGSSSLDTSTLPRRDSVKPARNSFGLYSSEPLWETYDEPEPEIPTRWRGNIIDKGSLYALKKENIAGRELPFLNRPPVKKDNKDIINNIEQKREMEYISRSHLTDNTQTKFNQSVIQHFYKAPVPRSHPGYGMPRPETSEQNPFRLLIKDLERDPSIVPISNYPSLTVIPTCSKSEGFCEILGPSVCSVCIEGSNRLIGDGLQRILFPEIEMTKQKLVQPKLAKVMRDGHLNQMRKRRLRELHFPTWMLPMKRQETNLLAKKMSAGRREMTKLSSKHSSYSVSSRTTHLTAVQEEKAV